MDVRPIIRAVRRAVAAGVVVAVTAAVALAVLAESAWISTSTPMLGPAASFLRLPLAAPRALIERRPATNHPVFAQITVGIWSPGGPHDLDRVAAAERAIGKHAAILALGQAFDEPLDTNGLRLAWKHGSLPMVTWYPWSTGYGRRGGSKKPEPAFALRTIIDGAHDAYIRAFAHSAAAFRRPFILRLAPEMNGTWYPWSTDVTGGTPNGNQPGQYVSAWRHVHRIFDQQQATNVIWDWGPNTLFSGQRHPLATFYPGDAYVDLVGIDGYNWGTVHGWGWLSPARLFGPTVKALRQLTDRPIILNEVGSAEQGGDKAAWVARFLGYLEGNHDIAAFVWFDWRKETDWRFASSPASRAAFADGLRSIRFTDSRDPLLASLTASS